MSFSAALVGFGTGLSLIVAIGAQNAHVLRQGITRRHVWLTVAICAVSDAVLIVLGVAGIGLLIERAAWLLVVARLAGALFLSAYALFALRRALIPTSMTPGTGTAASSPLQAALVTLALTWLNPHVYLDTVLLLGSIGNSLGSGHWAFALGAIFASLAWFTALGTGARLLAPVFAKPRAWQVLDLLICALMAYLAFRLFAPLL